MNSILNEIAAYKRELVARRKRETPEAALLEQAQARTPLDFTGAIAAKVRAGDNAVIAEVKKASPSKGLIRPDFDPGAIAEGYAQGGAACLSVLTDARYFQGANHYLTDIRTQVRLPILRKDFMLDPWQVIEARAIGADAILIILAMVEDALAADLAAAARGLGLAVLPEVHDAAELERALRLNTRLIGINNRNLHTFETSLDTTLDLLAEIPEDRIVVTESGIRTRTHIARMNDAGVHAFLIGESLMRQPDPGAALADLLA